MAVFWELSTDRALGFGVVGQLPSASIDRYIDRYGYNEDDADLLRYLLRAMDHVFVKHVNRRRDSSNNDNSPDKEPDRVMTTPLSQGLFKSLFGKKG